MSSMFNSMNMSSDEIYELYYKDFLLVISCDEYSYKISKAVENFLINDDKDLRAITFYHLDMELSKGFNYDEILIKKYEAIIIIGNLDNKKILKNIMTLLDVLDKNTMKIGIYNNSTQYYINFLRAYHNSILRVKDENNIVKQIINIIFPVCYSEYGLLPMDLTFMKEIFEGIYTDIEWFEGNNYDLIVERIANSKSIREKMREANKIVILFFESQKINNITWEKNILVKDFYKLSHRISDLLDKYNLKNNIINIYSNWYGYNKLREPIQLLLLIN